MFLYKPSIYLGSCVILWGLTSLLAGVCKNRYIKNFNTDFSSRWSKTLRSKIALAQIVSKTWLMSYCIEITPRRCLPPNCKDWFEIWWQGGSFVRRSERSDHQSKPSVLSGIICRSRCWHDSWLICSCYGMIRRNAYLSLKSWSIPDSSNIEVKQALYKTAPDPVCCNATCIHLLWVL